MSTEGQKIYSEIMSQVIKVITKYIISASILVLLGAAGFYFNTSYKLIELEKEYDRVGQQIEIIHTVLERTPTIEQYHRDIDEIKFLLRRLDDKIDAMK